MTPGLHVGMFYVKAKTSKRKKRFQRCYFTML